MYPNLLEGSYQIQIFWIFSTFFSGFWQVFWNFGIAKSKLLKFCEIPVNFRENPNEKWQNSAKFCKNLEKIANFYEKLKNLENFEFVAVQRFANLVDLEKCCKMSIWLQKSALIQPRTSPPKFAGRRFRSPRFPRSAPATSAASAAAAAAERSAAAFAQRSFFSAIYSLLIK